MTLGCRIWRGIKPTVHHGRQGSDEIQSVVDSSHAHPAASPGAAGESRPAAEACQQAVMEAECESVTHSACTSK